jgi:hypothetical protein
VDVPRRPRLRRRRTTTRRRRQLPPKSPVDVPPSRRQPRSLPRLKSLSQQPMPAPSLRKRNPRRRLFPLKSLVDAPLPRRLPKRPPETPAPRKLKLPRSPVDAPQRKSLLRVTRRMLMPPRRQRQPPVLRKSLQSQLVLLDVPVLQLPTARRNLPRKKRRKLLPRRP